MNYARLNGHPFYPPRHGLPLTNAYSCAGVANLHLVPETGCLLSTGFPKIAGGTGGYSMDEFRTIIPSRAARAAWGC